MGHCACAYLIWRHPGTNVEGERSPVGHHASELIKNALLLRFSRKVARGFFRYFFDHSYFFCARLVRPTTPQELNGLV